MVYDDGNDDDHCTSELNIYQRTSSGGQASEIIKQLLTNDDRDRKLNGASKKDIRVFRDKKVVKICRLLSTLLRAS